MTFGISAEGLESSGDFDVFSLERVEEEYDEEGEQSAPGLEDGRPMTRGTRFSSGSFQESFPFPSADSTASMPASPLLTGAGDYDPFRSRSSSGMGASHQSLSVHKFQPSHTILRVCLSLCHSVSMSLTLKVTLYL